MTPPVDNLTIWLATAADAARLARFNKRLIEEEGHRNPMDEAQLAARMLEWLLGKYFAGIAQDDHTAYGYLLARPEGDWLYIRQLYIEPGARRCGIGRRLVEWAAAHWPNTRRMRIDVLVGNTGALEFWRAAGFRDYCITLDRKV